MAITIRFQVSYSQLVVFASELSLPFNDWTDRHVVQGFAWRPGSVSFQTISEAGVHSMDIEIVDRLGKVSPDALRCIEVPFDVPADGAIEIGSIGDTVSVALQPGAFLLRCEFLQPTGNDEVTVRLTFAKKDAPRFSVHQGGQDPEVFGELLTTAEPALG